MDCLDYRLGKNLKMSRVNKSHCCLFKRDKNRLLSSLVMTTNDAMISSPSGSRRFTEKQVEMEIAEKMCSVFTYPTFISSDLIQMFYNTCVQHILFFENVNWEKFWILE